MTFETRMGRSAGLAGVFGGIVFALLASSGSSRSAHAGVQKDAEPKFTWIGAVGCQECHSQTDQKNPLYLKTLSFDFVRLQENNIWSAHDLHSLAYKNLTTKATKDTTGGEVNATAQTMEGNLKRSRGAAYTVVNDVNCLACHSSSYSPLDKDSAAAAKPDFFKGEDGVGCEMCHGHGSKYRNEHKQDVPIKGKAAPGEASRDVPWRTWAPKKKFEEYGLVNLRDPAVAAAKCASCHVGSKDEGRFVTHEMYAVGHPPLPPLDLMAYSREQPRHWGLPSQMPYLTALAKKDPKKAFDTFHFHGEDAESSVARRFVESTIGTLRSSVSLTKQLAKDAQTKMDGLDYAAFDCYSCHHNLKYPSDRQARGYDGPPGRPTFRLAPFALARVVVDDEKLGDELDKVQKQLAMAFGNKSYGDPELVLKAVAGLDEWCDKAAAKVADVRYKLDATEKLLKRIIEAAGRESPPELRGVPFSKRAVADPELAQMYVWAATTLILDREKDAALPASIAALRKDLEHSVVSRLRLPPEFDLEVKAGAKIDNSLKPVSERIHGRMEKFNSFDGDLFRKAFKNVK